MRDLINLAATVIEASGATQRRGSAAQAVLVMVVTAIVSLCGIGALICLLTALWLYEEPVLGEVGAPLVVAAVLAAVALIAGLVLHAKTKTPPAAPSGPMGMSVTALSGGLQTLMRSNKMLVLIGALMIGMAAGEGNRR